MPRWFRGGVHPDDAKNSTQHKQIEQLPPPERLVLSLSMHIGAPCEPVVSPGQEIYMGQLIADSQAAVSAPIHSPVSGKVAEVSLQPHVSGTSVMSVVLENDGKDTPDPSIEPFGSVESLSPERLLEIVRQSGIVGLGGAAFPTHFKIKSALGSCDTVILNGCECEPYITSDHRIMLEAPEEITGGLRVLMKILSPKRAVIAVESNKRDAVKALLRTLPANSPIEVAVLPAIFPQGAEKQLIRAVTGREVPPGGLPSSVKCAVFNIDTAAAIHRAVTTGMPLLRRVVTVAGSAVSNAKNLFVRIGTPIEAVFEATGGFRETPSKILMGGPMMGVAQHDLGAPVIKATNALLAFSSADTPMAEEHACIRCGKCVEVCPMNLLPVYLYMNERKSRIEELERLRLPDCIECGACSYTCPARLFLVHSMRTGKQKIADAKKK